MKKLAVNILFLSVTLLYIMSTMGVGVHKCATEGTASLIILYGDSPCSRAHSHDEGECMHHHDGHSCCSHKECHSEESQEHSNDCCSTSVYVITPDQDLGSEHKIVPPASDVSVVLPVPVSMVQEDVVQGSLRHAMADNVGQLLPGDIRLAQLCTFMI